MAWRVECLDADGTEGEGCAMGGVLRDAWRVLAGDDGEGLAGGGFESFEQGGVAT